VNKTNKLFIAFGLFIFSVSIITFSSCKRINESTELGGDLIPAVDNITTFDTTLTVESFNDVFVNDSTRLIKQDLHYLGKITNDPLFGSTDAQLFLEMKPTLYPFTFGRRDSASTMILDSVVLVLGYNSTYGDTSLAAAQQNIQVSEINTSTANFRYDSNYLIANPGTSFPTSGVLGSKFVYPYQLDDSVKVFQDTTKNQLRIKLSNTFGSRILNDSTVTTNDSSFRSKFKGFALKSVAGGNAVMAFDLNSANTKLAFYYKYPIRGSGGRDTTVVTYLRCGTVSANANYVKRDFTGSPFAASLGGTNPDDLIYIDNTPGSFATIKIPALSGLSNRIVHRAELVMEQVYSPSDITYATPERLFVDFYDSSKNYFASSLYDFYFNRNTSTYNYNPYGTDGKTKSDGSGNRIKEWRFNFTRYVQGIVTGKEKYYPQRLYSPFLTVLDYSIYDFGSNTILARNRAPVQFNSSTTAGRVRLGGGNHASQKMKLRIIYSKI
jgi:Domain of unknown function (DUF4270)